MKKKKNSSLTPASAKAWYYKPLQWLNIGLVLLSFLSLLAPFTDPKLFWPFALLGLITPIFLALHLLFFLVWAYRKHWYAFLSLGILIMSWSSIKGLIGFQTVLNAEIPERELKVTTFNMHSMVDISTKKILGKSELTKVLKALDSDVLCMQEFRKDPKFVEVLKNAGLKYYIQDKKQGNSLLMASRFPLKEVSIQSFGKHVHGLQIAELSYRGEKIHIYNTHLRSNNVTLITNDLADNADLKEKETWRNIRTVASRYKEAALLRSEQAAIIAGHLQNSELPSIVCGDLNDVVQSYTYHKIKGKHKDAFLEGGRGWGSSYAGKIPGLRIDYIFTDPSIRVNKSYREPAYFSDHHPVSAWLQLER